MDTQLPGREHAGTTQLIKGMTSYRPDIDGLRAVAVLAVVLNHLSSSLVPGGYVGVDIFFVISGYLITAIISREIGEGRFSFARFYERRARRIFPALLAVLAATLTAGYFLLLPSDYARALQAAVVTIFFASNFMLWKEQVGYFETIDTKLDPLLHMWSLAVEEQFYLLFPVFLLLGYRYFRQRIAWALAACALVSLSGAAWLAKENSTAAFFLSPLRAWELLAGALLALGFLPPIGSRMVREAMVAGGLASILMACFAYSERTTFPGLTALVPVLGAAAIIYGGTNGPTAAGRMLQWRPIVYIGLISYSLYLWHWPLIVLAQYANGLEPLTTYLALLFLASLVLASASYHFIEQPFRRGSMGTSRLALRSKAGLAFLLSLFCVFGVAKSGFPDRFDAQVVSLDKARSPLIPYDQCSNLSPQAACFLGAPKGEASMLLWGDSHLLSYAPVLQEILLQGNIRAVFLPYLGCAPLFDAASLYNPACAASQAEVNKYLVAHPQIKTVVVAAFWSRYFHQDGPVKMISDSDKSIVGVAAAQTGLRATLKWLQQNKRAILLIGPVPTYSKNVPAALALETVTGKKFMRSTSSEEKLNNAPFLSIVDEFKPSASFQYLSPIDWLCANECQVVKDGISLYRDAHHLSTHGAIALRQEMSRGFFQRPAVPEAAKFQTSLGLGLAGR
ncbi:acyltransferase family protein [soil metagenome]